MIPDPISIEKCPPEYDSFRDEELDGQLRAKAKAELREDAGSRDAALAQIREFIAKHPQIVRCRTDVMFLLRFLRMRKFNVVEACNFLELGLTAIAKHPECFQVRDSVEEMNRFIRAGVIVPLGYNRDDQLVVLYRVAAVDTSWMTPAQIIKYAYVTVQVLGEDNRFQIGGVELIFDIGGTSMAYVGMWKLSDLNLLFVSADTALPARIKKVHVAPMVPLAVMFSNLCMGIISTKMRERVVCWDRSDFAKAVEEFTPTKVKGTCAQQ
ncbi:clavesin-1-like [Uranotaenia lowii]|uniref:clavesin-1-like n=1 Tax=Uranotaenia lowii TaxID=190385 RepID=UPI002478D60A|nr:clavesin-1-like [Uranotaenia lowii]